VTVSIIITIIIIITTQHQHHDGVGASSTSDLIAAADQRETRADLKKHGKRSESCGNSGAIDNRADVSEARPTLRQEARRRRKQMRGE
jgi:hypothetical protein